MIVWQRALSRLPARQIVSLVRHTAGQGLAGFRRRMNSVGGIPPECGGRGLGVIGGTVVDARDQSRGLTQGAPSAKCDSRSEGVGGPAMCWSFVQECGRTVHVGIADAAPGSLFARICGDILANRAEARVGSAEVA